MPKNIVICCDGTNNQIGGSPTNVLSLFSALDNDPVAQVAFYNPGVGTMAEPGMRTPIRRTPVGSVRVSPSGPA